MRFCLLFSCVITPFAIIYSQPNDSTKKDYFKLSGFIDVYYQYDFDNPAPKKRPDYIYNHKNTDQLRVNLALLKAAFKKNKWKANLGLMAGDYSRYNLAAEPGWARIIYEAFVGYAFNDKVSVDAGILPSHIGFESAISKDNWILCRSLLAENSPYYETGVKLNYAPNSKWAFTLLVLNGWQHIKDNNSSSAFGTQVQYKPNDNWVFNSSTFLGNEKPDSLPRQLRFFNNFFASYAASKKLNMAMFFDYGIEEKPDNGINDWLGFVWQWQWKASDRISSAFRYEYYKDKTGVIVTPVSINGFRVSGFSSNLDWTIIKNILWRNEVRVLYSTDKIFSKNNISKNNNVCFLSSIGLWF